MKAVLKAKLWGIEHLGVDGVRLTLKDGGYQGGRVESETNPDSKACSGTIALTVKTLVADKLRLGSTFTVTIEDGEGYDR